MKILQFDTQEEWLAARLTRITGSRLNDIVVKRGTGEKVGFYELIAERIALPATSESAMDRGHRLEVEAIERFQKETGKQVDTSLMLWVSETDDSIGYSPDGCVVGEKEGIIEEAVEVKCLASARHIEAYLKQEIPSEYDFQKLQAFIVNPNLKRLYWCFYDPRLQYKDFFYFVFERDPLLAQIDNYLAYQREKLQRVNEIVKELSF